MWEKKKSITVTWRYAIFREVIKNKYGIGYYAFGIAACGKVSNGWTVLECIHNVSTNETITSEIAQMLNEIGCAPIYLYQVTEIRQ